MPEILKVKPGQSGHDGAPPIANRSQRAKRDEAAKKAAKREYNRRYNLKLKAEREAGKRGRPAKRGSVARGTPTTPAAITFNLGGQRIDVVRDGDALVIRIE